MSVDLTIRLGNLELQSPIIVGSCPMTTDEMQRIGMIHNGAGAIVLPSLATCEPATKIQGYFQQLEHITQSTNVPVIASFRANPTHSGWGDLLAKFQSAGAAAIEISLQFCPSTTTDPRQIEDQLIDLIRKADRCTNLPLFLKLTPNFTSISYLAQRLHEHIQGLVMFGRLPVVDIALDNLSLKTEWGLTQSGSVVRSLELLMRTRKGVFRNTVDRMWWHRGSTRFGKSAIGRRKFCHGDIGIVSRWAFHHRNIKGRACAVYASTQRQ